MIDLTPLDVRNKRGDFKKLMRGYDPQEVDVFLELVAERLEALVRENIQLRDRTSTLQEQVQAQAGREQAVQDALVTAQELRKDIREQSQREADQIMREAESESRRMIAEAEAEVRSRLRGVERQMDQSRDSLQELERRRQRFLQEFRGLLQRELDVVSVEEERIPLEDRTVDLELGSRRGSAAPESALGASMGASAAELVSSADETGGGSHEPEPHDPAPVSDGMASPDATPPVDATPPAEAALPADAGLSADAPLSADAAPNPDMEPSADSAGSSEGAFAAEAGPSAEMTPGSDPAQVVESEAAVLPSLDPPPGMNDAPPVDVADLQPEPADEAADRATDSSPVGNEPSSLELELMAGAGGDAADTPRSTYPEVPDLETVLAEAGIDEVRPPAPEEISPPPAHQRPVDDDDRRPEDRLALFDKDKKGKKG